MSFCVDEMNIHLLQNVEAKAEAISLMSVSSQLLNAQVFELFFFFDEFFFNIVVCVELSTSHGNNSR